MRTPSLDAKKPLALVLGAGASRAVSYSHEREIPSPLDSDFWDLLNRFDPADDDRDSVSFVKKHMGALPPQYQRSMERAFYTLHLKAYLAKTLGRTIQFSDEEVVANFARSIQALLRKAHGKHNCTYHTNLLAKLCCADTVVSFNYDLVVERALKSIAIDRGISFDDSFYGLKQNNIKETRFPLVFKLHGSSNWKLPKLGRPFEVRTHSWKDFDDTPGYRGYKGEGTTFPIFLPFWDKRIEKSPWRELWKNCARRLNEIEFLVVWGYSLPSTDVKSQQLFSLTLGEKPVKLCLIDPAIGTRERWREVLPKALYWEYEDIRSFLRYPPRWWKDHQS